MRLTLRERGIELLAPVINALQNGRFQLTEVVLEDTLLCRSLTCETHGLDEA